jgi:hypothetical protein
MVYRAAKSRKNTRRNRKLSRKMTRKARSRRQRGGGNVYEFTVATPITPASRPVGNPSGPKLSDLGTITAGDQSITINTAKQIVDIQVTDGVTPYKGPSFSTTSGTKLSFQITSPPPPRSSGAGATVKSSLVSSHVTGIPGTTALPGPDATTGMSGSVLIKGLGIGSFGKMPSKLTFKIFTAN